MRGRRSVLAVAASLALAAWASSDTAAAGAPASKGYAALEALPDWRGVWENISGIHVDRYSGANPAERERFPANPPPYNAEYAARYKAVTDLALAGKSINDPTANCVWPGMPRLMWQPYPFEFVFEPGIVRTNHEYMSQIRRIFTDGRGHPEDLDPSFNGHSIGRWEGDTLVVETVGLKADTMLQNTGMPHSDAMRLTERIRLIGPDLLEDEITIIDPKAFTRPYVTKRRFQRRRDWSMLEYDCQENNRNPTVDGVTQFLTAP